jgi:predicted Zn finger-like uncharacterized protein
MRAITNCPACQTQFFVTEEQLNQHNGKVRCGHCLHVFDAKQQIIDTETATADDVAELAEAPAILASTNKAPDATSDNNQPDTMTGDETPPIATNTNETSNEVSITDYQPSHFDDFLDKTKLIRPLKKSSRWLWLLFALILSLLAIAQSIYYLRNEIAIYYPNFKPYLVKACEKLACSIELPRKIEFIVIDDSDIQEDAEYAGLMRLSSTLINQASFTQAYPNLELTLTDVEDKPKLRRFFTPKEYLPKDTDIAKGLAPGEEVKIKLAMTTAGESVAGYRVFVTY